MRWRRIIIGLAALGGLALVAWIAVLALAFGIGGVGSGYRARDGDLLLTQVARSGLPMIAALEAYRGEHGTYPDPAKEDDISRLARHLPAAMGPVRRGGWLEFQAGSGPRWTYYRSNRSASGYTLSLKLGWDPRLIYHSDGGGRWEFDPGDGRETKTVVLHP
jgi:hypothetical protein